jgi:HPr kinase/phosphorylase
MTEPKTQRLHATSIAWQGCAALLLGPSGSGKSSVALHMLALGCDLVADDQCLVQSAGEGLLVTCPEPIVGQIDARNFGILDCSSVTEARLICAVDLSVVEAKRLPDAHSIQICGQSLRLFHNSGIEGLPFALLQYLKSNAILCNQG